MPLGRLESRVSEIPRGRPLAMQCQGGSRSAIAASLLKRAGFSDVSNLAGRMEAWKRAGLPTTQLGNGRCGATQ